MRVVSWNLEGRLSQLASDSRGTPEKIVAAIAVFDADILVHPEAFGMDPAVAPEIEESLRRLGYKSVSVAYDDAISRGEKAMVPNPHLRIMSRLPIISHEVIRPSNMRSMVSVTLHDPMSNQNIRVIGIHLDDRSETLRLQQVGPLIEYINSSPLPTLMMGDFNAMPPCTFKSSLIHSTAFRELAGLIPHPHMRYTVERLSDMASGTTISTILRQTRLQNTDPGFQPTTTPKMRKMEWMPSIRFAKIDWIFVSPDISYKNVAVSRDLGSDHRALSLEIFLKNDSK